MILPSKHRRIVTIPRAAYLDLRRGGLFDIDPNIHRQQLRETARQESCTGKQHHGEGDFRDNEYRSHSMRRGRNCATRSTGAARPASARGSQNTPAGRWCWSSGVRGRRWG